MRLLFSISLGLLLALSGCASSTNAAFSTFRLLNPWNDPTAGATLNPQLRYLRVTNNGKPFLMVLGYVDKHPHGDIEVWYSSGREVLKLQNGRVVEVHGAPLDVRRTRFVGLPEWSASMVAASYKRERDLMPGYRYGLIEEVTVSKLPAYSPHALKPKAAGLKSDNKLEWFAEVYKPVDAAFQPTRAVYALVRENGVARVVYSEQCLSADFCMTFQEWSAQ